MAGLLDYALTTIADVKESLGIDAGDSSKNNLIIRKINQATEMIEAYCGLAYNHHFKQTTYTNEEYSGSGISQLSLKMRPVTSVTSFQRRTSTQNIDDWDEIETELYYPIDYNAGIIDLGFTQGTSYAAYRVSYVAGYATIPADLAEACVILAGYLVEQGGQGAAIVSKREGAREVQYAVSLTSRSIIESLGLDDMLARYINYDLV